MRIDLPRLFDRHLPQQVHVPVVAWHGRGCRHQQVFAGPQCDLVDLRGAPQQAVDHLVDVQLPLGRIEIRFANRLRQHGEALAEVLSRHRQRHRGSHVVRAVADVGTDVLGRLGEGRKVHASRAAIGHAQRHRDQARPIGWRAGPAAGSLRGDIGHRRARPVVVNNLGTVRQGRLLADGNLRGARLRRREHRHVDDRAGRDVEGFGLAARFCQHGGVAAALARRDREYRRLGGIENRAHRLPHVVRRRCDDLWIVDQRAFAIAVHDGRVDDPVGTIVVGFDPEPGIAQQRAAGPFQVGRVDRTLDELGDRLAQPRLELFGRHAVACRRIDGEAAGKQAFPPSGADGIGERLVDDELLAQEAELGVAHQFSGDFQRAVHRGPVAGAGIGEGDDVARQPVFQFKPDLRRLGVRCVGPGHVLAARDSPERVVDQCPGVRNLEVADYHEDGVVGHVVGVEETLHVVERRRVEIGDGADDAARIRVVLREQRAPDRLPSGAGGLV